MGNLDDELEGSQRQGQGLWIHAVPMTSHTSEIPFRRGGSEWNYF